MRIARGTTVAAACLSVAIGIAACGSDGSGSSNEPSSSSNDNLKVMIITPTETSLSNWPESVAAVKAAARGINARGGIKGKNIDVLFCNEKNQAGQGAICAQQAVQEKVLAVVASFNNSGGVMAPLLKAGIPVIGDSGSSATGDGLTSSNSFVLSTLPVANAACPAVLKAVGATNTTTLAQNFPAAVKFAALVTLGAKTYDLPFVGEGIFFDPATTDFAPVIQQLQQGGTDSAVLATTEQASVSVLSAGGTKFRYCHSDASVTEANLRKLGAAAGTYTAVGTYPPLADASEYPLMAQMVTELDAELAAGDQDAAPDLRNIFGTTNPWFSMYVLDKVANQVTGTLDSQSLLDQLHKTTALDSQGLLPPIDFTRPATQVPDLASMYVNTIRAEKWDVSAQKFVAVPGLTLTANDFLGPQG